MLKGKKILAVLLAVIMMLSVTPVAFADETDVNEVYIDAMIRYYTLRRNVYEGAGLFEGLETGENIISTVSISNSFYDIKDKVLP